MDLERQLVLETRIQDLLAGALDEAGRVELLWQIAGDDQARRTLAEMIDVQRQARQALGLDLDPEFVKASLARTLAALRAEGLLDAGVEERGGEGERGRGGEPREGEGVRGRFCKRERRGGDRRLSIDMADRIVTHRNLEVYRRAFDAAMRIFELSKGFSKEESYALTGQIRRSSRSVCANVAEARRKRRYELAFISKLSDAETEAGETQTWLEFALRCGYLDRDAARELYIEYDQIIAKLVHMMNHPKEWLLPTPKTEGPTK